MDIQEEVLGPASPMFDEPLVDGPASPMFEEAVVDGAVYDDGTVLFHCNRVV